MTPPSNLAAAGCAAPARTTARCQELAATCTLVREFRRHALAPQRPHLHGRADRADGSVVRELRGLVGGMRKDQAAVTAGLTLPLQFRRLSTAVSTAT